MPMAAFDTISVAKRLEKDFGMPMQQAEGVAVVLHENFVGNVATKKDLEGLATKNDITLVRKDMEALDDRLTAKIETLEENMATKVDITEVRTEIAEVRTEIARSSNRTIYALGGLIGFLFIVDRFVPILSAGG